jgi:ATP-dependent Clp protease ATP-binding subunit ClpA
VIQRSIGDRLATAILDGTIGEGDHVTVDATDDQLVISRQ